MNLVFTCFTSALSMFCNVKKITEIIKILIKSAEVWVIDRQLSYTLNNDTILEKIEEFKFTVTLTINKTQFCWQNK